MAETQNYDVAVLIGRFQPFHNGHAALLAQALATAPQVMVMLGSAHIAPNAKNPFTWEERAAMIAATLDEAAQQRVRFLPVRDYCDDRRWGEAVAKAVKAHSPSSPRIALLGYAKDASSHYLNRFPDWDLHAHPKRDEIDATAVRQIYFEGEDWPATQALLGGLLPQPIVHYLRGWMRLPRFAELRHEHAVSQENRRVWGPGPFVTVDALVTAARHVLLIERAHAPGKGQLAMPGGYLEPGERLLHGAIRELREETGLALLPVHLEHALRGIRVFDKAGGRTVTHAHWFELGDCRLPTVTGGDDAAQARWVPIDELAAMESMFYEDHFCMLDHFLSIGDSADNTRRASC